jgi:hypothetical protein
MDKSKRREAQRFKERYGMKVTNTSIRLIAILSVKPKKKKGKR